MASVAAVSPSTPINNAETITSSSSPLIKPKEEIDDAPLDTSSELINTKEEDASQNEFATTLVSTIENYQQLRRQGRLSITSISNLINHNDGNNSEEASQTNGSDNRKRKQLDSSGENEIDDVDENTSTSTDHASAEALLSLFKRRRVSISEAAQDINSDQDEHENAYKDNNFGCATNNIDNNKTNDNDEDELAQPPSPVPSFDDTPLIDDSVSDDMSNAATIISKMSSTVSSNHPMHGPNGNGGSVGGIILPPSNFSGKQTRKKPYIPRPPNSFILYRQHHHPIILNQHPGINNSEISRIIADHWKNLSDEEKQEWRRKAEEAKEHHMKAYPDYKYQPRRRAGPHTTFRKANIHIQNLAMEEQEKFVDNHFVIDLKKLPPSQQSNANEEDHEVPRTDVYSSSMEDVRMINNDNRSASRFIKHEVKGRNVVIIEGGSKELSRIARTRATPAEALKSKLQPRTPSALLTSATTSRILHPLGQAPSPTSSPPNFFPRSSQPQPHTPTRLPPLIPPNVSTSNTSSPTSPGTPITTRGAMIVLEGCEDGSTALQAGKLHDFLKNEGIEAKLWKFPDHTTPAGNALKSYQQSNRQPHPKTLHLLIAAHWWELMPIMKDHLLSGTTLIVDRYVYSAIAASAAAGLELNWCKASYVHLLSPDLIFFLSVSGVDREANPASVSGGSEAGTEQGRSNVEWQRRMQDAFLRLAEVQWKLLDASKSSTLVHTQITQASIEVIERCRKCNTSYGTTGNNNILPLHQSPPGASSSAANISSPQKVSNQSQQQQLLPPPLGRHEGFARPVHVQL